MRIKNRKSELLVQLTFKIIWCFFNASNCAWLVQWSQSIHKHNVVNRFRLNFRDNYKQVQQNYSVPFEGHSTAIKKIYSDICIKPILFFGLYQNKTLILHYPSS